jgi:hypothetical protein
VPYLPKRAVATPAAAVAAPSKAGEEADVARMAELKAKDEIESVLWGLLCGCGCMWVCAWMCAWGCGGRGGEGGGWEYAQ